MMYHYLQNYIPPFIIIKKLVLYFSCKCDIYFIHHVASMYLLLDLQPYFLTHKVNLDCQLYHTYFWKKKEYVFHGLIINILEEQCFSKTLSFKCVCVCVSLKETNNLAHGMALVLVKLKPIKKFSYLFSPILSRVVDAMTYVFYLVSAFL